MERQPRKEKRERSAAVSYKLRETFDQPPRAQGHKEGLFLLCELCVPCGCRFLMSTLLLQRRLTRSPVPIRTLPRRVRDRWQRFRRIVFAGTRTSRREYSSGKI